MSKRKKNVLVPAILIVAGILLWLVALLASASGAVQYGTVAEWIGAFGAIAIGGLAAWFAALAWTEAKAANLWAAKAVGAEKRTQRLMEQELASSVTFTFKEKEPTGRTPHDGLEVLELAISDDSPVVWIKNVENVGIGGTAVDQPPDMAPRWGDSLTLACSWLKGRHIARGGSTITVWTDDTNNVDPHDAKMFFAEIKVTYTVTDDDEATHFVSPRIPLELRAIPRVL